MARGTLWRHRDFRRLWGGETVSELGSQVSVLAIPLCALYLGAVLFAKANDRRRARRRAADPLSSLSPDEPSPLDLAPTPLDDALPPAAVR